jgi:hypothetical protein
VHEIGTCSAATSGALRLVPCSHHPDQGTRLAAYRARRLPIHSDAEAAAYLDLPGARDGW